MRSLTSFVSSGTMPNKSPTTPRSQNSKIGAFGILIDGDDSACTAHSDLMLDRARDAACDVELRRYRFARLPDLMRVSDPARVDRSARRPHRTAERVGECFDDVEMLGTPQPSSARNDDRGLLDA